MKSALNEAGANRAAWALALAGTLVLLAAVVLPPVLPPALRGPLVAGFHTLCHQLPERSFAVGGVPLAACHRCTGIYAGLVLGVLVLPFWRSGRAEGRTSGREGLVLLVAVVPAALDWGGEVLGVWAGSPISRVGTGLWFGVLAGWLLAYAVSRPGSAASPGDSAAV